MGENLKSGVIGTIIQCMPEHPQFAGVTIEVLSFILFIV